VSSRRRSAVRRARPGERCRHASLSCTTPHVRVSKYMLSLVKPWLCRRAACICGIADMLECFLQDARNQSLPKMQTQRPKDQLPRRSWGSQHFIA